MKSIVLNDRQKTKDYSIISKTGPRGEVIVRNLVTGEEIYKGLNKVVIAGSAFLASKLFNITPEIMTPSYNEILGLEKSVQETTTDGVRKGEQVFLFAVGFDGCGKTAKEVKPVKYNSWISPDFLVPFRYQPINNDLTPSERTKYFGRKTIEADKRIAYYFKKFENQPTFKQVYLDGTPIDENVYTSDRTDEIESVIELHLIVNQDDCRDYFNQTIGREESRLSSISILTAWAKEVNGITYYQDIRPLTKYHFSTEDLIENTKGLDITYLLYF